MDQINLFDRAAWLKGRPYEMPQVDLIDEIIRKRREIQVEDNFILYEIRDQDPEMPVSEEDLRNYMNQLFRILDKQRIKEPASKQLIDYLEAKFGKQQMTVLLNKIIARLNMMYEDSDPDGVLIARTLQLFHINPLPTLAGLQFARLHKTMRTPEGDYELASVIEYMYSEVEALLGRLFVEKMRPSDLSPNEYLLIHLQVCCRNQGEQFIDEIFEGRDTIPDTEFLEILRQDTPVWIDDDTILDLLEDDMSRETVTFLCQEPKVVEIDEDQLVRALAEAYNENARRDLVFLRNRLFEASNGSEEINDEVLNTIFTNKRERQILFPNDDNWDIETLLKRVLKYLEGDVIVKQKRQANKRTSVAV